VQAKAIVDMAITNLLRAEILQDQAALLLFTMPNVPCPLKCTISQLEEGGGDDEIKEEDRF
jgi:hypothetical protein